MASEPRDVPIAGRYVPEPDRPAEFLSPGLRAVRASDRARQTQGALAALRVLPAAPPRAGAILALAEAAIPRLLLPLGHGGFAGAAWVVVPAPSGPALSAAAASPWDEQELLARVLRPAAATLAALAALGLTHRAIRPDNLFRDSAGDVVLGPAWAEPPASLQPALFEPPASQLCLGSGRGDGDIADDVYALGVVLLTLALGRAPLAGLDDTAILRRKVELGSYDALVGREALPTALAELLRGMLAEDPEHRPAPALLCDPGASRSRRSVVRMPRPAERGLAVGPVQAWSARGLALAMAQHPEPAAALLQGGAVTTWLRRALANNVLATRLEAALAGLGTGGRTSEPLGIMRAVAVLDPLAPLCWRGVSLWPDGLGPALVGARQDSATLGTLQELVASEAMVGWARLRPERSDPEGMRMEARRHRLLLGSESAAKAGTASAPPGAAVARLIYELNPLQACASPALGRHVAIRLADLLLALEAVAQEGGSQGVATLGGPTSDAAPAPLPLDGEMLAFVAARHGQRQDGAVLAGGAMRQAELLGLLQQRLKVGPLPALAGWLLRSGLSDLSAWQNSETRDRLAARLAELAVQGLLHDMVDLLNDDAAVSRDQAEADLAYAEVIRIDTRLAALAALRAGRLDMARRAGRDVVSSIGLVLAAGFLMLAVLS